MKTKQFILNCYLFCLSTAAFAQPYFVDGTNGNDTYSGAQWNTVALNGPLKTIDKALSLATGTGGNIYVKQGTYAMTITAYTFTNKSLLLQGGFPTAATGTDVSGYSLLNTTTISYSGSTSPASLTVNNTGTGPFTITIKGFTQNGLTGGDFFDAKTATEANTSFTFVDMKHTTQTSASLYDLENLAAGNSINFTNVALSNITNSGGVIRLVNAAITAALTTVSLTGCTTTGANNGQIYLSGNAANPILQIASDCVFTNNNAGANNGGVFNLLNNTGSFVLSNITAPISGNKAANGGVIFFYSGNTGGGTFSNITFDANIATTNGGAIYYYTSMAAPPVISNVVFTNNQATQGGAICTNGTTPITVTSGSFCGNSSSSSGGAIYSNGGAVSLDASVINTNSSNLGGAINSSGTVTITNTTLSGNSAATYAGAVNCTNTSLFSNCTFIGNSALGGQGGAINTNNVITITSCNFSKNHSTTDAGAVNGASSLTINGSGTIFDANYTGTNQGGAINASTITGITKSIFRNNYGSNTPANNAVTWCDISGAVPGNFPLTNSKMQQTPLTAYTSGSTTGSSSVGNAATFTAATSPSGCSATLLVLPVTLVNFTVGVNNCTANFTWQTASEFNSSFYAVEESSDGINFIGITKVVSKNSITGADYKYSHPLIGPILYYRLKAVDVDGKFTYSSTLAVNSACMVSNGVSVFPNPASNFINITGLSTGCHVFLLDGTGKKLTGFIATATNQIINTGKYAKGLYILKVEDVNKNIYNVKVVMQ